MPSFIPTSEDHFFALINSKGLTVVNFVAQYCGPCTRLLPLWEKLIASGADRANFVEVDVDDFDELATKLGVIAMPSFHFYYNGVKLEEWTGEDESTLLAIWEKYHAQLLQESGNQAS